MFTVRQQYVKPLEVIWAKCASLGWGPHNTIHVDDLERNFELNKQSGVLISPFYLKPFAVNPCDGFGESLLDGTDQSSFTSSNDAESSAIDSSASGTNGINGSHAVVERERSNGSNGEHTSVQPPRIIVGEDGSLLQVGSEVNQMKSFEDIELQLLAR